MNTPRYLLQRIWLMGLCIAAISSLAATQRSDAIGAANIPEIDQAPVIDGRLNETMWKSAYHTQLLIETTPGDNIPAPVTTDAYIYHDGHTLYVAFRAEDPDPKKIRAFLRDRDQSFPDDTVGIQLDPTNRRQISFNFFSNPLGAQLDSVEDDLNKTESMSWDGIWDSAGRITKTGFEVEMAIPLRLFRQPEDNAGQPWAFELLRFYQRDFLHRISNIPRSRDKRCHLCQFKEMRGLPRNAQSQDIQLTPTLVAGTEHQRDLTSGSDWQRSKSHEFGADVRWGINDSWTLNATLNPDFSQIEADAPQASINNQFALFFAEKRPFFLEGLDAYTTQAKLIHTRVINNPDWGLKLTGDERKTTWAFFAANDTSTTFLVPGNEGSTLVSLDQPSTNFAGRVSQQIGNANFGLLTTRRDAGDYFNQLESLDMRWDLDENQQISAQWMRSNSHYTPEVLQQTTLTNANPSDQSVLLRYELSTTHWIAAASYRDFGKDFHADLGFLRRTDTRRTAVGGGYKWYGDEGQIWNKISWVANWWEQYDHQGDLLQRNRNTRLVIEGKLQSRLNVTISNKTQRFSGRHFRLNYTMARFQMTPGTGLQLGLSSHFGDDIDFDNVRPAKTLMISPSFKWNIGQHWLLALDHTYQVLNVAGGELFKLNLDNLRVTWRKDIRTFVRLTAQYEGIKRKPAQYTFTVEPSEVKLNLQLLYGYKIDAQTLIFVGVNSNQKAINARSSLKPEAQSIFVKFSYAWIPGY